MFADACDMAGARQALFGVGNPLPHYLLVRRFGLMTNLSTLSFEL
jgi:hypothetical protein